MMSGTEYLIQIYKHPTKRHTYNIDPTQTPEAEAEAYCLFYRELVMVRNPLSVVRGLRYLPTCHPGRTTTSGASEGFRWQGPICRATSHPHSVLLCGDMRKPERICIRIS